MSDRVWRVVSEGRFGHRGRWYVLALLAALVLGVVAAVPVLAAAEKKGFEAQVVGGKPVPDGKYPFMAALEGRFPQEPGAGLPRTAGTSGDGHRLGQHHVAAAVRRCR